MAAEAQVAQDLGDVPGQARDPRGGASQIGIVPEEETVVLHHGAAAGRIDHNGVHRAGFLDSEPCLDIGPGAGLCRIGPAHMIVERPAAALPLGDHDLHAVPCEHPDSGLVDRRVEHLLRATRKKHDPHPPRSPRLEDLR